MLATPVMPKKYKQYFKQGVLFSLAALVTVGIFQPADVMALKNSQSTQTVKRKNVEPLPTSKNSTVAQPLVTETKRLLDRPVEKKERKQVKELTQERKSHSKTFLNDDGTKTVELHTTQQHFKEGKSEWKDIDNSLKQKTVSGKRSFDGEAGSVSSSLKPLSDGVVLNAEGRTITIKPVGAANVTPEQKDDTTVLYRNVWKDVDLEYELRGEELKEIIVVKSKNAPTTFNFSVSGGKVINHPERKGELAIEGMSDEYSFSSLTLDVNGRGVISEERVVQAPTSTGIRVTLDKTWLQSQATTAFPMRIDPTFSKTGDANFSYKMYKSDNYQCNASNCYINTGSISDNGWKHWRTYLRFNYDALKNKTILSAKAEGTYKHDVNGLTTSKTLTLGHANCTNAWNCGYSTAGSAATGTNYNITFTNKLKELVAANNLGAWWVIKGQEGSSKSYKPYSNTKITVTYDTPTPMANPASPAHGATMVTTQPTLQANAVSDADGDAVQYYFRVATNPDGETGAVINSGWISSREWKVPEHILQDGRTYYWKTYVRGYDQTNPNWVRSFKVNMRTGKNSTQAYEEVGPIAVDLATGNATTSSSTHNISALGGDIGLSLNYNTPALVHSGAALKTATKYGLTGYYYNDPGSTSTLPQSLTDPDRLLMVRSDNKLSFNWGNGAASPGLPSDRFLVRWKGYLTVPTAGSYTLGVNADDGVRINLGTGLFGADEAAFDNWSYIAGNRWGVSKNLPANQPIPITIEYYEATHGASFDLLVRGSNLAEQQMPTTWLAPNANVLPDGWELGVGDEEMNFERLQVQSNTAVLSDSTGQKYEYTWNGSGYKAPENQDASLLRNEDNTYTVLDTDGRTYIFDAEGKLTSVTTPEDDRQPSALKYEYAGNPSRLVKVSDGINAARNGTLHYSGDSECEALSGFDTTPSGYLCAFKTTDGRKTSFHYKSGSLARIAQPGSDFEDYGYDDLGRIVSYRDRLANDAIAYGVRTDDASTNTELTYNTSGKLMSVKAPAPTAGAERVEQTLEYLSGATALHVVGAPEPHGFSRKVTYDSTFRATSSIDLANLSTTTEWHDTKDLVLSATDSLGMKSTTLYNDLDRPIDEYGPAPATWFGSDRKPIASKINDIPRTQTKYDEGINGLAVSVYDNTKLSGVPKHHFTSMNQSNEPSAVTELTNSTITPTDGLALRATGKIKLDQTGLYNFRLWHGGGARMYVDSQLVVDNWTNGNERFSANGTYTNTVAGQYVDVTIEGFKPGTSGVGENGRVAVVVHQKAPSQSAFTGAGLAQQLVPDYGLETSTTVYDAEAGNVNTATIYSAPEYGQVDRTTIDPGSLNLENRAEYESQGSGFLRQTSRTIPGGARTDYEYYSATDTRDNPCTPETEAVLQAGFIKKTIEPDPDENGSQVGRTVEYIYDAAGYEVAVRYNTDTWSCLTYDERYRPLTNLIPGATGRTVVYNYLVANNPLKTSMGDSEGTIVTGIDLLGRPISYTDTNEKTTETTYDAYGKVISKVSPIGVETFEYDTYDNLVSHKLDSVEFASLSYDNLGRVQSIDYNSDISLDTITRDQLGREAGLSFTVSGTETVSDNVSRYVSGEIKNGTENGVSKSYIYDKAGRLVSADIGDNEFIYRFDTAATNCSSHNSNNSNAGKSGNRASLSVNGQVTTYCYDKADRLISSSNATLTDVQYDARGNTIQLGNSTSKAEFVYDASDRNMRITSGNSETTYTRDVLNRIVARQLKENNNVVENTKYGFSGNEDVPAFTLDANNDVKQAYLSLPGGVSVAIDPKSTSAGALTYSLPNLHGDVMATVNGDGTLLGKYMTGPFGESLPIKPSTINPSVPKNTSDDSTTASYLGKHQKYTAAEGTTIQGGIIQMGARVYIPALGRFISVDPIEGAGDNAYVYANDPVNMVDLDGELPFLVPIALHLGRVAVQQAAKKAAQEAVKRAAQQAAKKRLAQQKKLAQAAIKRAAQQAARKGSGANRKITDWSKNNHGSDQMAARGVTKNRAKTIVKNGRKTEQYVNNEWRYRYETSQGVVVLNSKGRLVTAWINSSKYFNK